MISMKFLLGLLVVIVAMTFFLIGFQITGQEGGTTGQLISGGTLGLQFVIILCAIFVAFRVLQKQIVTYQ